MNDQDHNLPVDVLRDGPLKATIWSNQGENGRFYSTTLAKTFEKNGKLQDGHSFTGTDLLRISELARQAYAKIRVRRRTSDAEQSAEEQKEDVSPEPSLQ